MRGLPDERACFAQPSITTKRSPLRTSRSGLDPSRFRSEHVFLLSSLRYIFWTISDNWEWADGYCPKFGLAAVDRSKPDLPRIIRKESFGLFKQIAETKEVWHRLASERTWSARRVSLQHGIFEGSADCSRVAPSLSFRADHGSAAPPDLGKPQGKGTSFCPAVRSLLRR